MKKRVLIFIVCYNAEDFIVDVIKRIPDELWNHNRFDVECLIIDDQSKDQTFSRIANFKKALGDHKITILFNPENQGYGGNQKIGYHYAIENKFDAVVLLHGDGQYPPELIETMVLPILDEQADAVFGSRMMHKQQALQGRMPLYKWIGNQVLTKLQNWILKTKLSEFHTGFRAYSVPVLAKIPFAHNSNYFDFDTDIIIQLLDTGSRIHEISIPTHYGSEISRVNGLKYAFLILKTTFLSRFVSRGLFYDRKFDYDSGNSLELPKLGYQSSHQFALNHVKPGTTVLDLGCGPGFMARELGKSQTRVISIDRSVHSDMEKYSYRAIRADIEYFDYDTEPTSVDYILLLDIIEHLKSPEALFFHLRERYGDERPEVIITTANIAFMVVRLSLLLGQFNYGKRGILDLTHTRLFTFGSLRRLLAASGYEIIEEVGIPAPFPLALDNKFLSRALLKVNEFFIRLSKNLFAYQIAVIVRPKPTLHHLLKNSQVASRQRLDELAKA